VSLARCVTSIVRVSRSHLDISYSYFPSYAESHFHYLRKGTRQFYLSTPQELTADT
jgi:hypothetical protein